MAGYGDARGLGWVGRTVARSPIDPPIMAISLAHPGETTDKLVARWEAEVLPRVDHDSDNRLVIGLGSRDVGVTSTARSRLHLANMLDNAMRSGLKPIRRRAAPAPRYQRTRAGGIDPRSPKCASAARSPSWTPTRHLRNHEQWLTDIASVDSYCPRQAGYGLMTWLVFHKGWHRWLGIEPPAAQ